MARVSVARWRAPIPKALLLLPIFYTFGGCTPPRRSDPVVTSIEKPVLCENAPAQSSLVMLPTPLQVIEDASGVMWIAMDARAYEALSRNISSLRLALNEGRTIIAYYSDCVRAANVND